MENTLVPCGYPPLHTNWSSLRGALKENHREAAGGAEHGPKIKGGDLELESLQSRKQAVLTNSKLQQYQATITLSKKLHANQKGARSTSSNRVRSLPRSVNSSDETAPLLSVFILRFDKYTNSSV
ncbi:unnamed protein product [Pleuronectes platessa]|uniref:Uncharacterized protein n=1 Tax=Pleuronectes platessa TaxID=8262 RepID=A0A9N7TJI4_PLEPL|nr:unnamed protein product [Pleuronectes platessa]